jgi:hypothetical protein
MSEPADFLAKLAENDPKAAERLRKAEMAAKGHSTKFATVWADDIEIKLDQSGLIDGLLSSTAMTVVYGESGAGKTFVVIDIGCHVAAGMPWRGMAVEQGIVVYIAAESPESVQRRIWAWKQRHGVEHLPVLVVTSNVDMLNGDADELVALVSQIRESRGRVALTIVDTLARAMTGNENAPDDMGKFVAACGRIREASGGHVLIVHHCGKDLARGARGHSSLRAATDVELEITNGEAGGCIRVSKHRDEAGGTSYGFKLETTELGTNSKDRVVTTCVTVETEAPEPKQEAATRPRRLNDKGKLFVQAVEKALKYAAERPPYHDETRGVTAAVTVTVARSYWRQLIGWDDASEKEKERSRQDWKRGLESALAANAVRRWGDYLWLPISGRPVTRDRDDRDNPKGLLSRHVTVAREVAGGTVTGVTGVADVTVCHGCHGQEEKTEAHEDGLENVAQEEGEAAPPQPITRRNVTAVFDHKHARPMTLAVLNPDGTPQVWESQVSRLATGQTDAGFEVDVRLHADRGRRTQRRFGPGAPMMVVEGHGYIPCPLKVGTLPADVVNRLRLSGARVFVDTFGEVLA